MKTKFTQLIVFASTLSPLTMFVFVSFNVTSCMIFIVSSFVLFSISMRAHSAALVKHCYNGLHLNLNAVNHNINEALMVSFRNNERISLASSLSIKENLYALSSLTEKRFFPQNYQNVHPLVSVSLADYSTLARQSGVRFEESFDADVKMRIIRVDPSILNKTLSIILSNAISVTPKHGKVIVSTELCADYYSISVTDFSGGIKSSVAQLVKRSNTHSIGRRVDEHNRIHYGLGLISLRNLILGSNISVSTRNNTKSHSVIIKISRRLDFESLKGCVNF